MGLEIYFPASDTIFLDGIIFNYDSISRATDYLINTVGFSKDEAKSYINDLVTKANARKLN